MFKRKQMWNQLDQPFLERLRLRKLNPDKKNLNYIKYNVPHD